MRIPREQTQNTIRPMLPVTGSTLDPRVIHCPEEQFSFTFFLQNGSSGTIQHNPLVAFPPLRA